MGGISLLPNKVESIFKSFYINNKKKKNSKIKIQYYKLILLAYFYDEVMEAF